MRPLHRLHRAHFAAVLALLTLALLAPPAARAMDCPNNMAPTISGLRDCVQHAISMGYITDSGIATSLLAELAAAQQALDNGNHATAVNILRAFIYEVQAQSGIHIDADHAAHMVMHAQMVIAALS